MTDFDPLEDQVLQDMLIGNDERLAVLRDQLKRSTVKERDMTGVGFFLYIKVPVDVPRLANLPNLLIDKGLKAEIEGLDYGAGFVLWVTDGALDQLEGYCCAETWPKQI